MNAISLSFPINMQKGYFHTSATTTVFTPNNLLECSFELLKNVWISKGVGTSIFANFLSSRKAILEDRCKYTACTVSYTHEINIVFFEAH